MAQKSLVSPKAGGGQGLLLTCPAETRSSVCVCGGGDVWYFLAFVLFLLLFLLLAVTSGWMPCLWGLS